MDTAGAYQYLMHGVLARSAPALKEAGCSYAVLQKLQRRWAEVLHSKSCVEGTQGVGAVGEVVRSSSQSPASSSPHSSVLRVRTLLQRKQQQLTTHDSGSSEDSLTLPTTLEAVEPQPVQPPPCVRGRAPASLQLHRFQTKQVPAASVTLTRKELEVLKSRQREDVIETLLVPKSAPPISSPSPPLQARPRPPIPPEPEPPVNQLTPSHRRENGEHEVNEKIRVREKRPRETDATVDSDEMEEREKEQSRKRRKVITGDMVLCETQRVIRSGEKFRFVIHKGLVRVSGKEYLFRTGKYQCTY